MFLIVQRQKQKQNKQTDRQKVELKHNKKVLIGEKFITI